ncbi:hypothetical protein M2347_003412 [Chryseobacterium sp. H1D6B]|uniref:DUF2255 family protein n=1 Tax=Chryseobacterium sp. H1D6B TaxID=2940588 RepID=UPI0015C71F91|nr:DUF2255 family protein [Chryseobacterium sp. H1D6B]MDH6253685.1 hypothetical protein [Chryseobacterium sp. H1D6B]
MNKETALKYICENEITGIKAGLQRETFLEIWMVVVDNRIFARSWGFAERSWYNSFLEDPMGQIQCGDAILSINAHIPADINDLTPQINNAYLTKYSTKQFAKPITDQKHAEKTMEFVICE